MSAIKMRYTEFANPEAGLNRLVDEFLKGKQDLVGIEIGSFAGESAELFVKSGAFKTLYCIDPWMPDFDPNDPTTSSGVIEAEQLFDERFKDNSVVVKIKSTSDDAVTRFEDNSIDFLYIDGNHQYEFVKRDLQNYCYKVKLGGILSGHDYDVTESIDHIKGVKRAIDEFFCKPPIRLFSDNSWVYIKE